MRNQKQKTTTIVKMDRNSAAGQWWLNQSDREFSMEILTKQLTNFTVTIKTSKKLLSIGS